MEFPKQYVVWDLVDGVPVEIRVKKAIGMSQVLIEGRGWMPRDSYFDTKSQAAEYARRPQPATFNVFF